LGYGFIQLNQLSTQPIAAQNPLFNPLGSAQFSNTTFKSWIIEPQIEYKKQFGKAKLEFLFGTTFQMDKNQSNLILATNFTNDQLIEAAEYAGDIISRTRKEEYKYNAAFGRINLNWSGRYILNLTGRRD